MTIKGYYKIIAAAAVLALMTALIPSAPVFATEPTTSVTLVRLAVDGETVNQQKTFTYQELMDVDRFDPYGDGVTHYYHQGPVFLDDPDPDTQEMLRWNEAEDNLSSIEDHDMGAVKGTNLIDLCNEVGGMEAGEKVNISGADGYNKEFAYENVYEYKDYQGPMVLTWYKNGKYPDTGYDDGMKLVFFADTSTNPWGYHVFGVWDWHEAADEEYWYYWKPTYPTTSNFAVKCVNEITIYSDDPPFWDCNEDGTCDLGDIVSLGMAWGETGEPGFTPEDVNRDGVVNILDVVKVGMYWGKSYSIE